MSDEIKACITCEHCDTQGQMVYPAPTHQQQQPKCKHPKAASRDLIYGLAFCANERATEKGCGKKGKLWACKK